MKVIIKKTITQEVELQFPVYWHANRQGMLGENPNVVHYCRLDANGQEVVVTVAPGYNGVERTKHDRSALREGFFDGVSLTNQEEERRLFLQALHKAEERIQEQIEWEAATGPQINIGEGNGN